MKLAATMRSRSSRSPSATKPSVDVRTISSAATIASGASTASHLSLRRVMSSRDCELDSAPGSKRTERIPNVSTACTTMRALLTARRAATNPARVAAARDRRGGNLPLGGGWSCGGDEGPIVAAALNGVLDTYSGWRGPEHWAAPRPGAAEFLDALRARGYRIVIHTTRWRDDAEAWLRKHGLLDRVDLVTNEKVAAHVFVDDRAVCFRGDFDATLREIEAFSAHWES